MFSCSRRPLIRPLTAALALSLLSGLPAQMVRAQNAVLTQNNDNSRTGQNTAETTLTPANVNTSQFGKLLTITGLEANVNGQVLYDPSISIAGITHNVVFAYTSNNQDNSPCGLWAFDADTGAKLWHTPLPNSATYTTATPVIDPATNIIYILTKTDNDATGSTFLHALDITTGAEKTGSPVQVKASAPGTGDGSVNGVVSFDGTASTGTFKANDRPGLLLLNGVVYTAFAHNSDSFPYHGWILGYTYDGTKLTQTAKFCATPNGGDGGIWMAGKGLTADAAGFIYCSVGNGTFNANVGGKDYGMCYLKLKASDLSVVDYFAPFDEQGLSNSDLDLGNSGVVGIPGTNRLFGGGTKFGAGFLLDSSSLGGFTPNGSDKVVLRLNGLTGNDSVGQNPVAWDASAAAKYVYLWANGSNLEQFRYVPGVGVPDTTGTFSPAGIYKQTSGLTSGASLAVSSNGGSNGILWTMGNDSVVRAFDATDVTKTAFWTSAQNSARDSLGSVGHFQFPTVVNGKVFVPTNAHSIVVYGLLAPPASSISGTVSLQSVAAGNLGQSITFTLTPTGTTGGSPTTQTVTLAASNGAFTLSNVVPGTYTLGVKGSKWLRKNVAVNTTGGNLTGLNVPLLGGDFNGDNQVSGADFLGLRSAYGSTPTAANWNPNADFNCDGQVSGADFLVLRSNYGKIGD